MRRLLAASLVALPAAACTNDYGDFEFGGGRLDGGGAGGSAGAAGSGGAAGSTAGASGAAGAAGTAGEGSGCRHNADCGTITGICAAGLCLCGGEACVAGETCVRRGMTTGCSCNGRGACDSSETCCPGSRGCTDGACD